MPNVVKFREDPDAPLVMSLEEYDEVHNTAVKAPIMLRDVVGPARVVTSVETAEEGLLVSLNERGRVDLDHIAGLYGKDVETVIAELGDQLFHDPETGDHQTRTMYLSGNVRRRLAAAEASSDPKHQRNVAALKAVQPADLLPGDIDANLGAPWLPADHIREFVTDLLEADPDAITVAHFPKDAVWAVDGDSKVYGSAQNTSEFGTGRADALTLVEHALNMKSPTIYDIIKTPEGESRVLNQEETFAAKEKQRIIKERFQAWIFTEHDRSERLVRIYNDTFNNLVLPKYDGTHLDYPGMAETFTPRQHQRDVTWRVMSGGNTLMAHAVGAGKAQPLDAKILTPTGWTTMGQIAVGDEVIAGDGSVTRVTGVFPQGRIDVFRLRFSDGSSTRASGDHLWLTQNNTERARERGAKLKNYRTVVGLPKIRTTDELASSVGDGHRIPTVGRIDLVVENLPLDAYTLGVLIGDASFRQFSVQLALPEADLLEHLILPPGVKAQYWSKPGKCPVAWMVAGGVRPNPLNAILRELGLWGMKSQQKFIPPAYKRGSYADRLSIVQGLMDADGGMSGRSAAYTTYSSRLAADFVDVIRSLGGTAHLNDYPGASEGSIRYRVFVKLPNKLCPFRMQRKVELFCSMAASFEQPRRTLRLVQADGQDECQCISVEHPSHLYVTDDFIVTHNTSAMAMSAIKLKQTGLVRKSMVITPNHMLEQFSREFLQVYPNARLLVAAKDDLQKDRRRLLTAKIATGDWDAVVVTHSSFERIGMSRVFQHAFIAKEIGSYAELLIEAKAGNAPRNVLKHVEKRKAAYEEKLKLLLADRKKDDGLVFDELGVDHIFVDEAHYAKNLEVATKMDRVSGIQTTGSQRAFDIYMKCHYLDSRTPGRGVTFATGTPISNSMVEMYTVMRYLAPAMLADRGIEHFDAWAASFGEVVENMEISPDGATLRPRSRFSKFVNLPELQTIFRSFSDVQTADMLKLPVPRLRGGKATIVSAPMSDAQRFVQTGLIDRYERIRRGGVNPKEDNALAITTDGRKLALDLRLIEAGDGFEDAKTVHLIENVVRIWRETAERRGTQMIFSDMGVNETAWGFSVYGYIIEELVARGIPRGEIANIGDANTDAKKASLFGQMRAGRIRVLIGSTSKMGTGTNVQKRLVGLHHLDAPWKPAEIEQRDGRILRQGNDWEEVEIFRYVTEGSFDAFMWQALENKARFIIQIMKGGVGVRRADDIGGAELSFAEVKAIASGNPAVLTLAEMDADLQRLKLLQRSHSDEQFRIRSAVKNLPDDIGWLQRRAGHLAADYAMAAENKEVVVGSRALGREDAVEALNEMLKNYLARVRKDEQTWALGSYRGFKLSLRARAEFMPELVVAGETRTDIDFRGIAAGRLLNQVDTMIEGLPEKERSAREQAATKASQLEGFKARVGLGFERRAELTLLQGWRDDLEKLLTSAEDRAGMDMLCLLYQTAKGAIEVRHAPEPEAVTVREPFADAAAQVLPVDAPALPRPETNVLTPVFAEAVKEEPPVEQPKPAPVYEKPASKRVARRSAPEQMLFQF